MNNKVLTLLGFAAKAVKLSYGMSAVKYAIISGKARLVLTASDISPKSRKEIAYFCEKENVKYITLDNINMGTVSAAVGRKCGIISVNDSGFADSIGGNANDQ
ncbi:MAG: ribosomal L7Ae/L30e/S12e/Gadd45 family protein [Clostridia bacterium]|nr:ribosomal L7Ae/L30e/S12e/Gadd45 family protein [Clostridia bacterium]MBQ2236938.1 ribosomal L7Ae/L30e/S12e/Gadd45 family protein [Clostridia bacterium]MEE1184556.1 ribosomal L7Ae/L30e/S12e/Gadd45 family protein [Acutalibacteraceae bacterium]